MGAAGPALPCAASDPSGGRAGPAARVDEGGLRDDLQADCRPGLRGAKG